jgi:hypothetical protein
MAPGARERNADRINAGPRIDPENCEVECVRHGSFCDPYNVLRGLTDDQQAAVLEFDTIDQNWFARAADGDTWVLFEHLPEATRAALENKWWKQRPSLIDPKTAEGRAARRAPHHHRDPRRCRWRRHDAALLGWSRCRADRFSE